jgi:glucuronoarabinoxylan endo-1,4-beta-xylanase
MPSGDKSSDPLACGCFISNSSNPGATCTAAAAVACTSACTSGGGYDYGHALHADSTAWGAFDIIGTHEYDDQTAFAWPSDLPAKDKEVWMTEMAGVKWWPEQGPSNDINDGVVVAQWIHSALVTGQVSAWLWWWYQPLSGGTNDNEGLLALDGSDTKRHYTLGNYSKFVRPGYVMVNVSGSPPSGVLLSAFTGSGNTVVVAINSNSSTQSVPITISGGTAPTSCTPYLTSSGTGVNLTAQTAVSVSGGAFTASLVGPSVTTFVCK